MKILVCISHVPDTTSKINFTDNNTKFDTAGVQFIIGPYDDYALARAIELKEANPKHRNSFKRRHSRNGANYSQSIGDWC